MREADIHAALQTHRQSRGIKTTRRLHVISGAVLVLYLEVDYMGYSPVPSCSRLTLARRCETPLPPQFRTNNHHAPWPRHREIQAQSQSLWLLGTIYRASSIDRKSDIWNVLT